MDLFRPEASVPCSTLWTTFILKCNKQRGAFFLLPVSLFFWLKSREANKKPKSKTQKKRWQTGSQKCQTNWLESKTERKRKRFEWLTGWLTDWLTDGSTDRWTDGQNMMAYGAAGAGAGAGAGTGSGELVKRNQGNVGPQNASQAHLWFVWKGQKNILARNLIWLPVSWPNEWINVDGRVPFVLLCCFLTNAITQRGWNCKANLCRALPVDCCSCRSLMCPCPCWCLCRCSLLSHRKCIWHYLPAAAPRRHPHPYPPPHPESRDYSNRMAPPRRE